MPSRFHKILLVALCLGLPASGSLADLTPAQVTQLETLRGLPVLSSDGALVGRIDGASVQGGQAALFLRPVQGSLFRFRGKDVIVRTQISEITLQPSAIVLNADAQRIRIKATRVKQDDDMIDIILPRR